MRIAVAGVGAVGARAARQLASTEDVTGLVIADRHPGRAASVAASLGPVAEVAALTDGSFERDCDAAVLAGPPATHVALTRRCLAAGLHVVSTSDAVDDVDGLLELDHEAAERRLVVVAAAGFSPGLSCLLARHLAGLYDEPLEVHVARSGHGGPACGRHRDRALSGRAVEWREGRLTEQRAGSGRQLAWFPDPLGGRDCYRAAVPDPVLLARALPSVERATARVAAPPFGRLAARLGVRPGLRRPPADGGLGGFRVEVRGRRDGERHVEVYGAVDRPAVAAGTVAAVAIVAAVGGRMERFGAGGLGEMADPVPLLTELARRGVKAAVFEGAGT